MRLSAATLLAFSLLALNGCHSAYIEATVRNNTSAPISLLEVDYPSASFGKETLAAGGLFHYRFKTLGSGGTKVLWTDVDRHEHTVAGPHLAEGDEGTVEITIAAEKATWQLHLLPKQ